MVLAITSRAMASAPAIPIISFHRIGVSNKIFASPLRFPPGSREPAYFNCFLVWRRMGFEGTLVVGGTCGNV